MKPRPSTKGATPPWIPLERLPVASHGASSPLGNKMTRRARLFGIAAWNLFILSNTPLRFKPQEKFFKIFSMMSVLEWPIR